MSRRSRAKSYLNDLLQQIQSKKDNLNSTLLILPSQPPLKAFEHTLPKELPKQISFEQLSTIGFIRKRNQSIALFGSKMNAEEARLNRDLLQQAREHKKAEAMNQTFQLSSESPFKNGL